MSVALVFLFVLGLLLVGGPVAAGVFGFHLAGGVSFLMFAFGGLMILISGLAFIVTNLYVRTKASEALVKTGQGGIKVIKDGGAIVIPVVHEILRVSLETLRLRVARQGQHALLTHDKLRADIAAEFFVRVMPKDEDIMAAARSLGEKSGDEKTIMGLIEDKLVNALRTSAAKMTLEELNTERDKFVKDVMELTTADLKHNGYTLETVTISTLDQADTKTLRSDNIFDVQGARTIAETVEKNLTAKNEIERTAAQARLERDVQARQSTLKLEQERAEAEAKQSSTIARIKAEQQRESQEASIDATRRVQEAQLASDQSVALQTQRASQEKEVAQKVREQAVAVAEQERQKAQELAQREREIAVAEQNTKLAEAEQRRLAAEKARSAEEQAVETVKILGIAKMESERSVIAAEAEAQKDYVKKSKGADADAYRLKAEADAKKAAADADAESIRKKAEAEAQAAIRRADGEQAQALVAVNVKKQEVEVERARAEIPVNMSERQVSIEQKRVEVKDAEVDVLQKELRARAESGAVAQDFELAKLRIEAEASVRIETAKAAASFGQKFEVKLVGTPDQLAAIQNAWFKGESMAAMTEGFLSQTGPATKQVALGAGEALNSVASTLSKMVEGTK